MAFKLGKILGKVGLGALAGFATGGPLGAILGGFGGGLMPGALTGRTALLSGLAGLGGGLAGRGLAGLAGGIAGGPGGAIQGFTGGLQGLFGGRTGTAQMTPEGLGVGGFQPSLIGRIGGGLGAVGGGVKNLFTGAGGQLDLTPGFSLTNLLGGGQAGGGGFLPYLIGQGGIPGLTSTILGSLQQRKAGQRLGQLQDIQLAALGQARELGGITPEAQRLMMQRALEGIRSAQAERGIFESGVGAQLEAETLPLIEQQLRQQQMAAMLGLAQGFNPLLQSQAQIFGAF